MACFISDFLELHLQKGGGGDKENSVTRIKTAGKMHTCTVWLILSTQNVHVVSDTDYLIFYGDYW